MSETLPQGTGPQNEAGMAASLLALSIMPHGITWHYDIDRDKHFVSLIYIRPKVGNGIATSLAADIRADLARAGVVVGEKTKVDIAPHKNAARFFIFSMNVEVLLLEGDDPSRWFAELAARRQEDQPKPY